MMGWELIIGLVAVGAVLICIEMFVPGMILGILGAGCLLAAVLLAFFQMGPRTGLLVLLGTTVLATVMFAAWIQFLPKSPMARWMMIRETNTGLKEMERLVDLTGKEGTAETLCRPAGVALIEGRRRDVVAEVNYIEAGSAVRVVRVEGARVVVREIS
jgi:membrane-bound serine protease (ClpP class)